MTAQAAPFVSSGLKIKPEWIDFNGHLNMAYYMVLFDLASDEAFASIGMPNDYINKRRLTLYTAEAHIRYLHEVHRDTPLICTFQLVAHDAKRFHTWQELRHADEGWVSATCEMMTLHIDANGPKVTEMPNDIAAQVNAMQKAHALLEFPLGLNGAMLVPGVAYP